MTDHILRVSAAGGLVRGFFATTRELVNEAVKVHGTTPVVSAALGRLLTAGAIMGHTMKGEKDLLTITIKGDGPIGGLLVTADSRGNVKGYAYKPQVDIPTKENGKLDVGGAVGKGSITVVKDLGLKEPYSGQVELVSGEIAIDIANYYATSEQVPSIVALGVLVDTDYTVKQAGGFFIQLMPGAGDEIIDELEKTTNIPNITALLDAGMTPDDLALETLGTLGFKVLETLPCKFECNCSKERVARALATLPEKDLQNLAGDGKIEVKCHFCNTDHVFTDEELMEVRSAKTN